MRWVVALALLLLLAALPAPAPASPNRIYEDCQDGRLDRRYDAKDLRRALADMPVDLDEYTNCRELVRSAQQGNRAGGSGPGSDFNEAGGYGALPAGEGGLPLGPDSRPIDPVGVASKEEREEVERARRGEAPTAQDRRLVPAGAGAPPHQRSGAALPAPLVVLLVLTAAAVLAGAGPSLRRLVLRRSA